MDIIIRPAELKDKSEIMYILEYIGSFHGKARPDIYNSKSSKANDPQSVEDLINRKLSSTMLVAELNGKIVGELIYILREQKEDAFLTKRKWLYIDDLCVLPEYQGKGIATLLNKRAEEIARENGCSAVELNCWAFNKEAAKFYEKYGYTPQKTEYEKKL